MWKMAKDGIPWRMVNRLVDGLDEDPASNHEGEFGVGGCRMNHHERIESEIRKLLVFWFFWTPVPCMGKGPTNTRSGIVEEDYDTLLFVPYTHPVRESMHLLERAG